MPRARRSAVVAFAILIGAAGLALAAPSGANATTYRYWSYWYGTANSTWVYSSAGPASRVPSDRGVEGWHFVVSSGGADGKPPRVSPNYESLCPNSPAPVAGHKRVAVVTDSGIASDAPPGQSPPTTQVSCLTPSTAANGAQVLSMATSVRTDRGLICGLGGYPSGECAPVVGTAVGSAGSTAPTPKPAKAAQKPSGASASASSTHPATTTATSSTAGLPTPATSAPTSQGTITGAPQPDHAVVAAGDQVPYVRNAGASSNTGPIIGTVVGLALAIGLGTFAFVRSRRRR